MFQKKDFTYTKMGAQAAIREGTAPSGPPVAMAPDQCLSFTVVHDSMRNI